MSLFLNPVSLISSLTNLYCIGKRIKWTEAELKVLRDNFGKLKHPPNFQQIRELQRRFPALKERSLAQIKTRAWTLVSRS